MRALVFCFQDLVVDQPREHIVELIKRRLGVLSPDRRAILAGRHLEVDLGPRLVGESSVLDCAFWRRDID